MYRLEFVVVFIFCFILTGCGDSEPKLMTSKDVDIDVRFESLSKLVSKCPDKYLVALVGAGEVLSRASTHASELNGLTAKEIIWKAFDVVEQIEDDMMSILERIQAENLPPDLLRVEAENYIGKCRL